MSDEQRLAWVLVGLPVLDWLATGLMVYFALRYREPALEERATTSIILTLGATSIAAVAAAYLAGVELPIPSLPLLAVAFIALSIPQLVWPVAFLLGRFR